MRVPEEFEMDNGGTVTIQPVPPRLYGALVARYEKGRPRPEPPLIKVEYKGEEEPVMEENLNDPVYERKLADWRRGLDARLYGWFMENAVRIKIPADWDGGLLPLAGVRVPRPLPVLERLAWLPVLGGWLRARKRKRARLYYEYYATPNDVKRMSEGMLSAAGLYSEEMLGEAEDSFPDHDRRRAAGSLRDEEQRGPRVVDLHRTAGHGGARVQPGTMGGATGSGQGPIDGLPTGEDQGGDGGGREGGEEGQSEAQTQMA